MAKTTAPLLSFEGSGQIGKTQVYSKWRGVSYARRYVTPANPNSDSQKATRGVFRWLSGTWKLLDPNVQATFTAFAKGQPFTNRNAYVSKNLSGLRGTDAVPATTLAAGVMSPGANGGLAAASIATADHGDHTLDITINPPEVPDGWTVVKVHAVAFVQANANTSAVYTSYYGNANADPWTVNLAGAGAATYACFGFVEYTKPDGSTAYSPSLYAQQVVA
ncbi:MAG TPA: hypothetical protein VHD95_11615 [Rhizomicrobium sp.]|nr:hypothetical protein [Rhizomicrobium sp.]